MSAGWADLKCPNCLARNSSVKDSRGTKDGDTIRRRRECLSCGTRWSTYESNTDPGIIDRMRDKAAQAIGVLTKLAQQGAR